MTFFIYFLFTLPYTYSAYISLSPISKASRRYAEPRRITIDLIDIDIGAYLFRFGRAELIYDFHFRFLAQARDILAAIRRRDFARKLLTPAIFRHDVSPRRRRRPSMTRRRFL